MGHDVDAGVKCFTSLDLADSEPGVNRAMPKLPTALQHMSYSSSLIELFIDLKANRVIFRESVFCKVCVATGSSSLL